MRTENLKFLENLLKGAQHSSERFPLQVRPSMEGLSADLPGRQTQNTEEQEEWEQLELFFDLPPPDMKTSSPFSPPPPS
jgi:hypothetical protein